MLFRMLTSPYILERAGSMHYIVGLTNSRIDATPAIVGRISLGKFSAATSSHVRVGSDL